MQARQAVASRAVFGTGHSRRSQKSRSVSAKMRLESAAIPMGTALPDFKLPDPRTGKDVSMADVKGEKATLVMILSNHCPFVKLLKPGIAKLVKEYQSKGVSAAGISASSIQTHPQDGPELMAKDAEQHGYTFPYLYDESQQVAQAFRAMCTPEFYVFDGEGKLAYHGQFDDARPGKDSTPVTGKDLRAALDAVLQRNPAPKAPPSVGCSVKWHPGKQPAYAS